MRHDPALCETVSCELCAAFEDGYQRGKSKARFELEVWDGSHNHGCGCEPCRIVRDLLARFPAAPLDLPGPVT